MRTISTTVLVVIIALMAACNALNPLPPNQILDPVCGVKNTFYSTEDPECSFYQDCDIYDQVKVFNTTGLYKRENIDLIDAGGNQLDNVMINFTVSAHKTEVEDDLYISAGSFIAIYVEEKEHHFDDWVPCNTKSYYLPKDVESGEQAEADHQNVFPTGADLGLPGYADWFIAYIPSPAYLQRQIGDFGPKFIGETQIPVWDSNLEAFVTY